MTEHDIANKYVHGLHDALTDSQEKKDMAKDILEFAKNYHQEQIPIDSVIQQKELLINYYWHLVKTTDFRDLYDPKKLAQDFLTINGG